MRLRARQEIAGGLALIAGGLLGWGFWPTKNVIQILRVNLVDFSQIENRAGTGSTQWGPPERSDGIITLEYPREVRMGDSVLVRLHVAAAQDAPERGTFGEMPLEEGRSSRVGAEGAQSVLIQSRLELMGASVRPAGDITSPWSTDTGVGFVWTIRPSTNASARGTAWIFAIPPGSSAFEGDRIAISAQPVEIESVSLVGASGPAARATGGIAMVLAVVLGLPAFDGMLAGTDARRDRQPW